MQYQFIKNTVSILLLSLLLLCSCGKDTATEKHPDFSKNVIDVSNKIVPVKTDVIFGNSQIITVGKFLIVKDSYSWDKGFLLFDKKTFKYLTDGGSRGQGPGQIIDYRNAMVIPNTADNQSFYVFDYSQLLLYRYAIDSILNNKKYLPEEVLRIHNNKALGDVGTLNDSIFIGIQSRPISNYSFVDEIVRLNIRTGQSKQFGYENPEIKISTLSTHAAFTLSPYKDKYIQAYRYLDLMTICDINGNLICNVYGPQWGKKEKKGLDFYHRIRIGKKHIIAGYAGGKGFKRGSNGQIRGVFASKLLVFDSRGNYQKTLLIGGEIKGFCFDEDNNRIIFNFLDRDEPLGYLNLKRILN